MKRVILILLFVTAAANGQWVLMTSTVGNVNSIVYSGNNIFAGSGSYGASIYGVFLSTDIGTTWTQTSLNNRYVYSLAVNGNYIFAGVAGMPSQYGVYLSTNNGTSWTQTSLNYVSVYSLAVSGNYLIAGTISNGVYVSTNNGTTWTLTSFTYPVDALAVNGNNVYAGAISKYGVSLSTNNGQTWTPTPLNMQTIYSLTVNGNYVFAGGPGSHLSSNGGSNWIPILNGQNILAFANSGSNIFAGCGYNNGVYVSNNNGANWIQRNEGLNNATVHAFCIFNNYIFASVSPNNIYRRPLSELVGIHSISTDIPNHFSLSQNYPNPFNPTTKIKFDISKSGFAKLSVYDITGREVKTLVNEILQQGIYETQLDASDMASGVYYYRLQIADSRLQIVYNETRKMVVVK